MDKVADFIESWIIGRLRSAGNNVVIVRRNELAEELECAPSQVSYVLSTRFTVERGYLVESRRGSGVLSELSACLCQGTFSRMPPGKSAGILLEKRFMKLCLS